MNLFLRFVESMLRSPETGGPTLYQDNQWLYLNYRYFHQLLLSFISEKSLCPKSPSKGSMFNNHLKMYNARVLCICLKNSLQTNTKKSLSINTFDPLEDPSLCLLLLSLIVILLRQVCFWASVILQEDSLLMSLNQRSSTTDTLNWWLTNLKRLYLTICE